jgi:hypothetical protein
MAGGTSAPLPSVATMTSLVRLLHHADATSRACRPLTLTVTCGKGSRLRSVLRLGWNVRVSLKPITSAALFDVFAPVYSIASGHDRLDYA